MNLKCRKEMKRLTVFFLVLVFLNSCKTLIEPKIIVENEDITKQEIGGGFITGKITNNKNVSIASVAIKLVINDTSCLNSYSNFDGDFSFLLDVSKINKDSYFEIVYKGYTKKNLLYRQFINKTIMLEKGNDIVSEATYKYFYEEIRKCRK